MIYLDKMPENKNLENTENIDPLDISITKIPLPPTPCKESEFSDSVIIIEDNSINEGNINDGNYSLSDSVIILEAPPSSADSIEKELIPANPQTSAEKSKTKHVDEIMVTGVCVQKAANYPHARQHCFLHDFNPAVRTFSDINREKSALQMNTVYCDKCFCYVCDQEASKCKDWTDSRIPHCCAHSKTNFWITKRLHTNKMKKK